MLSVYARMATREMKSKKKGKQREKQLSKSKKWFGSDINLIKKLFRLQENVVMQPSITEEH